jgi:UDP-N-acetylmuramate dehydrogenase
MTRIIDFKKYTSINIGNKQKVKIINKIKEYKKYYIIGRGNNLLISNHPKRLAILGREFDYIIQKDNKLIVGASTSSGKLLTYCRQNNIKNFELLIKLPGNMGSLVKMNAGLKRWEIFNYLSSVKTIDGIILKDNINHSYRKTDIKNIIFEITFDIENGFDKNQQNMFIQMRNNQPHLPSAGSCFKNPKNNHSAGYLIEKVNLKGYNIGDMAFSSKHANFLVNLGNGTFNDAIKLITLAKQKVKESFGVNLEEEIIIL